MLGVATLIVVNAVMSGFSTKLKDRLHGVLSDVVIDTERPDGFEVVREASRDLTSEELAKYRADPRAARPKGAEDDGGVPVELEVARYQTQHATVVETVYGKTHTTRRLLTPEGIVNEIMQSPAGEHIEAISPTIETFAILQFRDRGAIIAKPIRLIGVDPEDRARVGGFSEYLERQKNSSKPSFELTPEALHRHEWNVRQVALQNARVVQQPPPPGPPIPMPGAIPPPDMQETVGIPQPKLHGVILGYTLAHFRYRDDKGQVVEEQALQPGDDVLITTAGGTDLKPVWGSFLVTDYIKTEMSEYDQSYVYVPLDQL
jgi:lipoprotein-releasing system permease protein